MFGILINQMKKTEPITLISQVPAKRNIGSFFVNLAVLFLGVFLFAGSHPNIPFPLGLPLLAWFSYIPVFWVIRRSGFAASFFYGAIYGYASYGVFNYWLSVFHPLAGIIVNTIYLVYLALLFPLLKLAGTLYPKYGYILQWLIWLSYEYLKTLGFLGYSYGITGYSQWTVLPLIQIASVTGVWGVSALVVFPSAALAAALPINWPKDLPKNIIGVHWKKIFDSFFCREFIIFFRQNLIPSCIWGAAVIACLIFGFVSPVNYDNAPTAKLALVQHNTDPWRGGITEYRRNFDILRRLSDEAIALHPDLDMVVWSETAFVPRIYWHTRYRDDPPSWILVRDLLEYLASQDVPFIIGNDDARKDPDINPFYDNRIDYNAAMLFERGVNTELYRKLHLVPFTEHFPYQRQFPMIHDWLVNADTHFWEKGSDHTVFNVNGIRFSTPICFEDTFGYLSREFTLEGAELIVNLSNDAWSASLAAQDQHLAMAVFRSVENRRAMARSTASGQTCGIDPNGRIIAMAEPFTEAALVVELPVMQIISMYTLYGDWLPKIFIALALILLIIGTGSVILKKAKHHRNLPPMLDRKEVSPPV